MKNYLYLLSLLFLPALLQAQKVVIKEDFEASCEQPWKSFHKKCITDWISVSGTPDTKSDFVLQKPFSGKSYAHAYLWNKAVKCGRDSKERGESMALNYSFKKGITYQLSFALAGEAGRVDWILTDGLINQTADPDGCKTEEIIPAIPAESQICYRLNQPSSLKEWQLFENIEFTPESDYSQLWFRPSSEGMKNQKETANVFLDQVIVEQLCPTAEDLIVSTALQSCANEESFGHIILAQNPALQWTMPEGSQAINLKTATESRWVNLTPGEYAFLLDDGNCQLEKSFTVIDNCVPTIAKNNIANAADEFAKNAEAAPTIFPNPNNGNMTIEMKAPEALVLTLEVFDAKGALVKSIDQTELPSGNFRQDWDVQNQLAAGIYHFYFQTNFGIFQKKVVISSKE